MSTQICIAVIIEKNKKILLVQEVHNKSYERSRGLWTIPAGRVEEQETLTQAAKREVKEETGFDVELSGLIGVYQMSSLKTQSMGIAFRARFTKTAQHYNGLGNSDSKFQFHRYGCMMKAYDQNNIF